MAHILDDIVDLIADEVTAVSLHDGDPGDVGANEISGGGYSRLEPSYAPASSGATDLDSTLNYLGPPNQQVTHYGLWRGASFWVGGLLADGPHEFNSPNGRLNVTSAPITQQFVA